MSSRSSDVSLVIRARDEAQKMLDAVSGALDNLFRAQRKVADSSDATGAGMADLAAILGTLGKAYSSLAGEADRADAAFRRQRSAIAGQKDELRALQAQAAAAAAALERLNSGDAIVSAGRDQSGRLAQIKAVGAEYDRLNGQISKLATAIARQESAMGNSASSLQRIGSTANAVEAAVHTARQEIEAQTRAMREQAAAAQVVANINRSTGIDRKPDTALAEQLQEESRAREAAIAKLREQEKATSDLAAEQLAQARAARFLAGAGSGKSARESASVFTAADNAAVARFEKSAAAAAHEERELAEAAARLRAQLDPVADIEARLATEQAKLNNLFKQGKISAAELSAGMKLLEGNAQRAISAINGSNARGRPAMFGLQPYELTNLGYQINDVVTQLASGTSLAQALGQQGGQILQLFPRVGAAVMRGLTSAPVIGFGAALAGLIIILHDAAEEAERLRALQGVLAASADGGLYDARGLAEATRELDRLALSAEDALKVVRIFQREGLEQSRIVDFGKAAKDLADILGIDAADAAQKLASGFDGTYDSIAKLDDATNLLTASERERVRLLFEQGKAQEALRVAFEAMSGRLEKGAQDMRGPWADATLALSGAWDTFIDRLSGSNVVKSMGEALTDLANGVTRVLNRLSGLTTIRDIDTEIAQLQNRIASINDSFKLGGDPLGLKQMQIDEAVARIKELRKQRDGLVADEQRRNGTGSANIRNDGTAAQAERDRAALAAARDRYEITQKITNAAEKETAIRLAGEKALREERLKGVSEAAAQEIAAQARQQRRISAEKELADYRRQAAADEARAVQGYVNRVVKAESGGDRLARNPASSATGLGQFIEFTWLNLFKQYFPDRAAGMTDALILELRKDAQLSKQMIEVYARENAAALKRAGQSVTEANLQLAHFLGPDGAVKVLRAAAGASISDILTGAKGRQAIAANPTILGNGATRESVIRYAQRRAGVNADGSADEGIRAQQDAAAELGRIDAVRAEKQQDLNDALKQEAAARQRNIDAADAQRGLTGEALIDAQREAEVQKAIAAAREKAGKDGLRFTEAQAAAVRQQVELEYEAVKGIEARAKAARDAVDKPVNDLTARRDALQSQITFQREQGNSAAADALLPQLDSVNDKLREAISNAIAFYRALDPANNSLGLTADQIATIVSGLETAAAASQNWGSILGVAGEKIADAFKNSATGALNRFAQAIADGKNAFDSLKNAFLDFAASFLQQIAQMIQQQLILNLISGIMRAVGGSTVIGAGQGGPLDAGQIFHSGGIVGAPGNGTIISPTWFANARRYHSGGIAGLRPDEVPAILQRGEEVLTESDPRHRANGGGGGDGQSITIMNSFDPDEAAQAILNTRAGDRAFLNMVTRNRRAFQDALSR